MQKEAAWLLGELAGLVSRGVLDEGTAQRLRAHYAGAAVGAGRLGWGMILLSTGGAALIGLGVILLFAHNWANWTPGTRVGLSLLPLLAGQAAAAWALRSGSRIWGEAAALFTAIAIGAGIALIAQTYQFGGDLPRFLLTWLLLAVPLVYLLDASAVASACWFLALGWVMAANPLFGFQGSNVDSALRLPLFLLLLALPLPHLVRHVREDRAAPRVAWMLRSALVALLLGLLHTPEQDDIEVLPLVYAGVVSAAALAGHRYFSGVHGLWGNPLLGVGRIGIYVVALAFASRPVLSGLDWPATPILLLPLLLGLGAAFIAWRAFRDGDRLLAPLFGALTPLVYLLPLVAERLPGFATVVGNLYVVALAGALIRTGLRRSRVTLATEGATLAAVLVMLRFFDADLSYVVRGVGFIAIGVAFFAALAWLRRRLRAEAA